MGALLNAVILNLLSSTAGVPGGGLGTPEIAKQGRRSRV